MPVLPVLQMRLLSQSRFGNSLFVEKCKGISHDKYCLEIRKVFILAFNPILKAHAYIYIYIYIYI